MYFTACKTESSIVFDGDKKPIIDYVLIRKVVDGEYIGSDAIAEMYVLFKNSSACAIIQDTFNSTEFNLRRKKIVNRLSKFKTIDNLSLDSSVKIVTKYSIKGDTLKMIYFAGDSSMYYENIFQPVQTKIFESYLLINHLGTIKKGSSKMDSPPELNQFHIYKLD